jgi:hypothetical protein
MVSVAEQIRRAEKDISRAESQLSQQEKELQKSSEMVSQRKSELLRITKKRPVTLTRQIALQQQVGKGAVGQRVKEIRKAKKKLKEQELPKIKKVRKQITEAKSKVAAKRQEVAVAKREVRKIRDFERGRKLALSDRPFAVFALENREQRRGYRAGRLELKAHKQRAALLKAGLVPIRADGKVIGFSDVKEKVSFEIEKIGIIGEERLGILREAGLIKETKVEVPQITDLERKLFTTSIKPEFRARDLLKFVTTPITGPTLAVQEAVTKFVKREALTPALEAPELQERVKEFFQIEDSVAKLKEAPAVAFETAKFVFTEPFRRLRREIVPGIGEGIIDISKQVGLKSEELAPVVTALRVQPQKLFERDRFERELKISEAEVKAATIAGVGVGLGVKGAATLIGETPAEVALDIFAAGFVPRLPKILRIGVETAAAGFGLKTVLEKDRPIEERIGGGIVAGLGGLALGVEAFPFVRGFLARGDPEFKVVETEPITVAGKELEARFIKGLEFEGVEKVLSRPGATIKQLAGEDVSLFFAKEIELGKIGLIPPGKGFAPEGIDLGEAALLRGGFGFSPEEQILAFAGKEVRLTTAQRGLIPGEGLFKVDPEISKFGFFFTPADPTTGVPQVRVSRLALEDLFKFPEADVKFTLTGVERPQIIVTDPTKIVAEGVTGLGGVARIAPKGTTELEATALANIRLVKELGVTTIKGQKVELFLGALSDEEITAKLGTALKVGDIVSTTGLPSRRVPAVSGLGIVGLDVSKDFFEPPTTTITPTIKDPFRLPSLRVDTRKVPPIVSPVVPPRRGPPSKIIPDITPPSIDIVGPPTKPLPPEAPPILPIIVPKFDLPRPRMRERKKKRRRRSEDRKRPFRMKIFRRAPKFVSPSLTASVLDLRGKFPTIGKRLGISPADIRVIPITPKKKKKKVKRKRKKK